MSGTTRPPRSFGRRPPLDARCGRWRATPASRNPSSTRRSTTGAWRGPTARATVLACARRQRAYTVARQVTARSGALSVRRKGRKRMRRVKLVVTALVAVTVVLVLGAGAGAANGNGKSVLPGSAPGWAKKSNFVGAADPNGAIGFRVYLGWQNA